MNQSTIKWRILITVLLVALILATAGLLVITLQILLLIFAGVLFAIFLNGISRWFERRLSLSYCWSFTWVLVLLVSLVGGGFYYMGSQMARKASALGSELESAWQQLDEQIRQSPSAQRFLPSTSDIEKMLTPDGSVIPRVMRGVRWVGWGLTAVLVIGFVGLYVAFDPDLYKTGLVKLVPPPQRPRAGEALHQLNSALGHWMIGRLISMGIIGALTAIGLALFGVALPITLGVVAGLLTFIPNLGPVLAAIPQALLALQVDTTTALYVILFNIVLQTVESYLVTPMIQRYEVTLPPAITIFAQLLMGVLVGIIGVIMAAPLTVVLMVLVQLFYIRDRLHDPSPGDLVEQG